MDYDQRYIWKSKNVLEKYIYSMYLNHQIENSTQANKLCLNHGGYCFYLEANKNGIEVSQKMISKLGVE